jgi:hypothetical protein
MLALGILSELQAIARGPWVQDFLSSCRRGTCAQESNPNRVGTSGKKLGNGPLRWAFAEAAAPCLRHHQPGNAYFPTLEHHPGNATALTVLAPKLARAVYDLRTWEQAVELKRFGAA